MTKMTHRTDLDGLTLLGRNAKPTKKLETFPNHHPGRDYVITLRTEEFTCVCPATGQPDFAKLTIQYIPDQLILESKSLKLFANLETRLDCWEIIRTGFYPPIHDRGIPPELWLSDYVQTYVERDLRTLVNIGDLETFERFVKLCAGRIGQLLNYSSLASDCGVAVDTARRWISVLKTSFIVFMLPPHYRNFNKRVIKSPKLYFHDTGLACLLLGIRNQDQLFAHPLRGALFENYIVAEVVKAYLHHRVQSPVFFWRDQSGHEIDLLIEDGNVLYPVEIKSASTVARDMFDGLKWWARLAEQSKSSLTLVYGGPESYTREGIAVRPWFSV